MILGSPSMTKTRIGVPNLFGIAATSCGLRTVKEAIFEADLPLGPPHPP